jgi:hypothetical protein
MPDRVLRLSKKQADDIATLCELGVDTLTRIAAAIETMPLTVKDAKIKETITSQFGIGQAESLERVLFGLATIHRRRFDDVSELLDAIRSDSWNETQRAAWLACRPAFEQLLSAESVVLATKALDLSFDVERFCVGARIITDLRPVFDRPRTTIVGSTIRQTLRLEYSSIDGTVTSVSIGLDAEDISRLKQSCEEALLKVSVAKSLLMKAGLTEILIPGEEDSDE